AELMAPTIISALGWDKNTLTEGQKQAVSALSTLAAGLAGGLTGDSTADALAGGQAGKNAVENNFLSVTQLDNFAHKAKTCEGIVCQQVIQDMVDTNLKQQNEMLALCSSQPAECADDYGYLVEQWNVFDKAIKQLYADDKLPNKFKNYLSAVYSSGMEAQGTVASVGWQQKFEALGLDKDTAAAMAATVPGLINAKGSKGGKGNTQQTPMLGKNGVQTSSQTIWKGVGKERIDVENPNPGQRPGQVHYQDNKNNKYDHNNNSFYSFDSAKNKVPAPSSVNKLLDDPKFKQAIDKGMKQYLGEK
ncbi:VENN motif pre-toxin domain-containing protein, partial [Yersinia pseudotuberculosis]|uniref:VENN motif pre-toxin domain-containing protein n=1 Tax=Yersinia pseudotuberculosis TaxID=633 RepID=UPI00093A4233